MKGLKEMVSGPKNISQPHKEIRFTRGAQAASFAILAAISLPSRLHRRLVRSHWRAAQDRQDGTGHGRHHRERCVLPPPPATSHHLLQPAPPTNTSRHLPRTPPTTAPPPPHLPTTTAPPPPRRGARVEGRRCRAAQVGRRGGRGGGPRRLGARVALPQAQGAQEAVGPQPEATRVVVPTSYVP